MLGYSPLRTGLAFLPTSLAIAIISLVVVPALVWRTGPKPLILTGLVVLSSASLLFSIAPVHGGYLAHILPPMLLVGIGMGLIFTTTVGVALSEAMPTEAGLVSGVTNVSTQIGGSIGVALIASVSAGHSSHLLAQGMAPRQALADGFHFGFVIAAAFPMVAFFVGAILIRSRRAGLEVAAVARAEVVTILE